MEILTPLNDCLLVEVDPVETYDQHLGLNKIILPEKFKYGPIDPPRRGKILSLGKECSGKVKKGDKVVFGKWAGAEFMRKGKKIALVREYDLLAVVV